MPRSGGKFESEPVHDHQQKLKKEAQLFSSSDANNKHPQTSPHYILDN